MAPATVNAAKVVSIVMAPLSAGLLCIKTLREMQRRRAERVR